MLQYDDIHELVASIQESVRRERRRKLIRNSIIYSAIAITIVILLHMGLTEVKAAEAEPIKCTLIQNTSPWGAGIETFLMNIGTVTESEVSTETTLPGWNDEEAYLLAKLAMAEAEGEDTEGKALVILTVLNRVQSDEFPDTIEAVIMEHNKKNGTYQFSTVIPGRRFWKLEPNEDCWEALKLIQDGQWDESQGALYFRRTTSKSTWHSRNLEKLFEHGKHTFYTEREVDAE